MARSCFVQRELLLCVIISILFRMYEAAFGWFFTIVCLSRWLESPLPSGSYAESPTRIFPISILEPWARYGTLGPCSIELKASVTSRHRLLDGPSVWHSCFPSSQSRRALARKHFHANDFSTRIPEVVPTCPARILPPQLIPHTNSSDFVGGLLFHLYFGIFCCKLPWVLWMQKASMNQMVGFLGCHGFIGIICFSKADDHHRQRINASFSLRNAFKPLTCH